MEKKQAYEKPLLRKVRLEVKTSVLATCNTSIILDPMDEPVPGAGCRANGCLVPPAGGSPNVLQRMDTLDSGDRSGLPGTFK